MTHFDVILTSYNFTMNPKMDELIAAAVKQGIGIVAMKVMAGGFRRAKPGDKQTEILKREGAMLAALKWVLKNKDVATTIPSITDNEQLDENLKAMSVAFSDADRTILMAQLEHISPLYCRCGSCRVGARKLPLRRSASYRTGHGQTAGARASRVARRSVAGWTAHLPGSLPNGVRVTGNGCPRRVPAEVGCLVFDLISAGRRWPDPRRPSRADPAR
jgi:hypothetical protein